MVNTIIQGSLNTVCSCAMCWTCFKDGARSKYITPALLLFILINQSVTQQGKLTPDSQVLSVSDHFQLNFRLKAVSPSLGFMLWDQKCAVKLTGHLLTEGQLPMPVSYLTRGTESNESVLGNNMSEIFINNF